MQRDPRQAFPRLRQSLLQVFDACPQAAKFDIDHRSDWTSHPAARGTLSHRAIGRCLQEMERQGEDRIPVDVALDLFDEIARQHDLPLTSQDPLAATVVPVPLRELASSRVTVRTWAMYARFDPRLFAGIEKRLSTIVRYPDPDGQVVEREVTGQIDLLLIDGSTAFVWDWKDTFGIPSERLNGGDLPDGDNISPEGYFQLRVYALLVFATYPRVQRVVLCEAYPRYLSGSVKDRRGRLINPVRQATVDRYQLPDLEREIAVLVEQFDRSVMEDVWPAAPGSHCSWCSRPSACPILPEARREGRITSLQEAEQVAGLLQVLDAIRKQSSEALRAWSRAHGEVPVRSGKRPLVYGPVVRNRQDKPSRAQLEAHVAAGGKPGELFRSQEHVVFTTHSPDELHPHAKDTLAEEERMLEAMRQAAEARKAS